MSEMSRCGSNFNCNYKKQTTVDTSHYFGAAKVSPMLSVMKQDHAMLAVTAR